MNKVGSHFSAMLNQAAVEAMYSANYVEEYLDCVENLPDDIQRSISQLRELDQKYQEILCDLDQFQEILMKDVDPCTRKRTLLQIQRALIKSQDLGDEKLQIQQQIQDVVENKSRQLDIDFKNLDSGRDHEHNNTENNRNDTQPERVSKRSRRQRNHDSYAREETTGEKDSMLSGSALAAINFGGYGGKKKKKKRKTKAERENSPVEPPIDPDEPTYCLCEQVSYGEMIGCDNDECTIEWFHFSCVGLTTKPKGKWYCPKCRGDRSNQMKPKFS